MKKATKLLALLLALCMMTVLFAGCGSDSSTDTAKTDTSKTDTTKTDTEKTDTSGDETDNATAETLDSIVVGVSGDAGSLSPWNSADYGSIVFFRGLLYENLCAMTGDGSVENVVMKDIEQIDDLTWHITIWDNITDSAGNAIKAEDVAWSVEQYVFGGNNRGSIGNLESCAAISDTVVEMKLTEPFGVGMLYKSLSNPKIVSKASYEASADEMVSTPVGSGPYVVTDYVAGSHIVLEKREDHWQSEEQKAFTQLANVDKITLQVILDQSQMAMALESGSIDLADSLSLTDLGAFENNDDYIIHTRPSVKPFLLCFNGKSGPTTDLNLRKAILTAVNVEDIVASLTESSVACTSISNPTQADYLDEWNDRTEWTCDVDAAKEFLAQSDYNGETLKLMIKSGSVPEGIAIVIQANLAKIGVNMEIEIADSATYSANQNQADAFDLIIFENGGGPYCPHCWKNAFSYKDNKTPNDDPVLAEKLSDARLIGDEDSLRAFQDYIDEMAYAKGLVIIQGKTASNTKVQDIFFGSDNIFVIGASTFAS